MAKILITIAALLILAFIVVAMYCACVLAGRSDDDDDNLYKEQICPKCKTGKYTYELDPKSDACPNISCWENGKCAFYAPLKKSSDTDK